ncbi:folylpolyglutamate synthase/dihydrofolate synthase family protein [Halothiobacillus sp.]|uniref:bifunctional folylpolyglutamate synthase/dihydrofolate synthase n=1 Tax=Halothiobacillus sp. TaxID=1891311 RepID=UPI002AD3D182|nr:folylpolyglutamate synthase/dihydrofolate synthase family protein [Halothiobacillus sp.]
MSAASSWPLELPTDRNDLNCWLSWLENRDPHRIELGLERVRCIWRSLVSQGYQVPFVITVAGTNGKGSSVALLESILRAETYRVGAYTSPHVVSFTERFRIDGLDIRPEPLVAAFEVLFNQPGSETLTYFEWATLAAFIAFSAAELDVWILEVGLGGRLDAVNVLDANLALITAIGLDHQAILGNDRVSIAREKAGILRAGQPAVYMDAQPEQTIADTGRSVGADLWVSGHEFSIQTQPESWSLSVKSAVSHWPTPRLLGAHQVRNAAGVVALLRHPGNPLHISNESIRQGLLTASVIGRFERWALDGRLVTLDVAHNEDSLTALLENISKNSMLCDGCKRYAVFSALADKPIEAMVALGMPLFDAWFLAELDGARAASGERLRTAVVSMGGEGVFNEKGIVHAYNQALARSAAGDQIVIFGSFLTVSRIRPELSRTGARLV